MSAILSIEVEAADVADFFVGLEKRTSSPQDFLRFVGSDLLAKFRANIDAESAGPDLPAWAPLAESTVKERERLGYGGAHPILKRTLALYSHLTSSITGAESVSAGTDGSLGYPETHDIGADTMPQRSFVWVDDARVEGWLEVLAQFLVESRPPPTEATA